MEPLLQAIPYILFSVLAVTLLCTVGAIASRRFQFNFVYLSIFSYVIYILIGYAVSLKANLSTAFLASLIVGFYDATVAWKLCIKLNANMGLESEQMKNLTTNKALFIMLFMAPFFTFIGYMFT